MVKHVVMDFKNLDIKVSGLEMVEPPKLSFKVVIDLDKKMEKGADKDPLLQQEFQAAASDVLEQTKETIEKKCKIFDKLFGEEDLTAKRQRITDDQEVVRALYRDMEQLQRGGGNGVRIQFDSGKRAIFHLDEGSYGTTWMMYANISS